MIGFNNWIVLILAAIFVIIIQLYSDVQITSINVQCYCLASFLLFRSVYKIRCRDSWTINNFINFLKRVVRQYIFTRSLSFGLPCGLAKILHDS